MNSKTKTNSFEDIFDYECWEAAAKWMRLTGDDSDLKRLEGAALLYSKNYNKAGNWVTRKLEG